MNRATIIAEPSKSMTMQINNNSKTTKSKLPQILPPLKYHRIKLMYDIVLILYFSSAVKASQERESNSHSLKRSSSFV